MTTAGARRGVRWTVLLILAAAVLITVVLWMRQPRVEVAPGLAPEPIAPFGPVTRADLVFRWAVPSDGAPVLVEILDADAPDSAVWTSVSVDGGSLRPPERTVEAWPLADMLWRPVAVPAMGPQRPADLAAFTLLP